MMKNFAFLLLCFFMLASCKNERDTVQWCDINTNDDSACLNRGDLSVAQLTEIVVGNWVLQAQGCGFCPGPSCEEVTDNITAIFTADGALQAVDFNGNPVSGTYSIESIGGISKLVTDVNGQFPRFSRICNSISIDDSRPADGPLFIFQKFD